MSVLKYMIKKSFFFSFKTFEHILECILECRRKEEMILMEKRKMAEKGVTYMKL